MQLKQLDLPGGRASDGVPAGLRGDDAAGHGTAAGCWWCRAAATPI